MVTKHLATALAGLALVGLSTSALAAPGKSSATGLSLLNAAQTGEQGGSTPQPANPKVKKKTPFFPILIGLIASGGAAAAAFGSHGKPASP